MTDLPVYLSAREAARITGYNPTAISTAYKRSRIKPAAFIRTGSGLQPLFTEDEIEAYQGSLRNRSHSKAAQALVALRRLAEAGNEEAKTALQEIEEETR